MPNQITQNGLEIKTITEVVDAIVASLQSIYGADINVSQNSPDGQLINIFAQAAIDNLELLMDTYNSMSIEQAYGTSLDQRVALNGIERIQGTYTITNVNLTVDRALNLTGLDALVADPTAQVFTVADDAGNQFFLQTSQVIVAAGVYTYSFRAATIGRVETTQNTITNQVTTILGVTAVNNPAVATSTGINEETDAQLKIRHAKMFQLASTGPADAVRAAMLEVSGVVDAFVVENDTNGTVNSVPAHSIQAIVNGGSNANVANAIYMKKAPGCGLYGAQSVVVTRPQGNSITINFDRAVAQNLYIQFDILPVYTGAAWDETDVKEKLAAAISYKLGQQSTVGDIVVAMLKIVPQGYLTSIGVSLDGLSYSDAVLPSSSKQYFVADKTRINIL